MAKQNSQIRFCTLGMVIIDEIHYRSGAPSVLDILGGAGTYSALGARLLSPGDQAASIGWVVDAGSDFPPKLRDEISSWNTACLLRETPDRLTTRGWNEYGEHEHRAFRYMTPKLQVDHESLNEPLLRSQSYHLICSPTRCMSLVKSLMRARSELDAELARPLFIWEPVPDLCLPEQLAACFAANEYVDVISPNQTELCSMFGKTAFLANGSINYEAILYCCQKMVLAGIGCEAQGGVVVRLGREGCLISSRNRTTRVPAVHADHAERVVDPTGGGNAFLGGFAIRLTTRSGALDHSALVDATGYGAVAASFAIEQVGMPVLSTEYGTERWNGENVQARLQKFLVRLDRHEEV